MLQGEGGEVKTLLWWRSVILLTAVMVVLALPLQRRLRRHLISATEHLPRSALPMDSSAHGVWMTVQNHNLFI